MGFNIECDQCGKTPDSDEIFDCGHCGQEYCDLCRPIEMKRCTRCFKFFDISCCDKSGEPNVCVWCGGMLEFSTKSGND